MGPRSCDRGKAMEGDVVAAHAIGFNGAAVMCPRKDFLVNDVLNELNEASMGPRSCDRGKSGRKAHRQDPLPCFNGAAVM